MLRLCSSLCLSHCVCLSLIFSAGSIECLIESCMCSRQQLISAPMMPRNAELRNLTCGAFRVHRNEHCQPFPMAVAIVAIHMSKSNKLGEIDDNRGIAHHRNILEDSPFLLSIHCAYRLFMKKGQPLPELYLQSTDWCASEIVLWCTDPFSSMARFSSQG